MEQRPEKFKTELGDNKRKKKRIVFFWRERIGVIFSSEYVRNKMAKLIPSAGLALRPLVSAAIQIPSL